MECPDLLRKCNNYVIHRSVRLEKDSRDRLNQHNLTRPPRMTINSIGYINLLSFIYVPIYLLICNLVVHASSPSLPLPPLSDLSSVTAPNNNNDSPDDCESCKLLVESFMKGMEKTMRGKHEGGDTSWEEKNLKNYADSEVRLVEIQEQLCDDLSRGKAQCFSLAEETEQYIEDWWFKHRKKNVRLHDFLCINSMKKCCPENSFGPTCRPCPSNCHGHGVCDGSGTRTGSGECICQQGYAGETCGECHQDFYMIQTLNANGEHNRFSCIQCHHACLGGCSGPSTVNCTECKPGYERDSVSKQCNDINECDLNSDDFTVGAKKLCPDGTYCLNTEGHYKCADCHRACSTCLAYGRDKCIACAPDHFMDDEHNCVYTSDFHRHDPNIRDNENYIGYLWRRFQTDIVVKVMLNILLYPVVRWLVDRVDRGSSRLRLIITFLATINLQMELYPLVQRMIVTNFGKNPTDTGGQHMKVDGNNDINSYPSGEL